MKYSKVKAYKYKLESKEEFKIVLPDCGVIDGYLNLQDNTISIAKGYAWDGSSVPFKKTLQVLSLGFYDPDKYCKQASLVHDALCQLMREGQLHRKYKQYIDEVYRGMCKAYGMPKGQANNRCKALRKHGDPYILPEKNPRNKIYDTEKT